MSSKYEAGSIVEGKVIKIKPFGAIVSLPDRTQGLIHISHVSKSYVENIAEHLSIGDMVTVKIISIDKETGRISLSIKEAIAPPPKVVVEVRPVTPQEANAAFEDKFKDFVKVSNERLAGLNKRNKRR